MANKILTAEEWRDSVQQTWDEAIRDSIQDQIREAVLAEREACAELAAWILKMPENDVSAAILARVKP